MYLRVFMRLRLRVKDLKSCEGENLLAFNDSSIRLCETLYLMISFEECINKRIVKMCFLVIPCKKKCIQRHPMKVVFRGFRRCCLHDSFEDEISHYFGRVDRHSNQIMWGSPNTRNNIEEPFHERHHL